MGSNTYFYLNTNIWVEFYFICTKIYKSNAFVFDLKFFIWSQNVYMGPTLHVDNRSTWNTIGVYSDDARQSEIC